MLIAFAISLLGGCSDKVDGSSDSAFKESMEKVAKGLSKEDEKKFGAAIMTIMFNEIAKTSKGSKGDLSNTDTNKILREKLDGMTANEIISMGEKLKKEGKGLHTTVGQMMQNAFKNAGSKGMTPPILKSPQTLKIPGTK